MPIQAEDPALTAHLEFAAQMDAVAGEAQREADLARALSVAPFDLDFGL